MRLIDADAITKETFVEFVGNQEFISFNDALWMISELPTAYDIDKVVEQLEALPNLAKLIDRDDAIATVKKG